MHSNVAVIIPSRISSIRLDKKPLQVIEGKTLIEHVLKQVNLTKLKNIYVATDSEEIANIVNQAGGQFIMTDSECQSGTDRVYNALQAMDNNHDIEYVINVQGDMPLIAPESIIKVIESLKSSNHDIMTPVVKVGIDVANGHGNVKVVTDNNNKALYFSRNLIPYGAKEFLYHVGVYGFRKEALTKFVSLPPSSLELTENLEQLRALQNGMSIGVCYINDVPISVDTPDDLNKAKYLCSKAKIN